MAKIHYIGTCSGTEPMPGMRHCCIVFEIGDAYYWFDAGEDCSYRAYLSGIDFMRIRAVFISHPHIDHIGGLANLFSRINKVISRYKLTYAYDALQVHTPDAAMLDAVRRVGGGGKIPKYGYQLQDHVIADGVIYEDDRLRVTALHNCHLNETGENGWHSYSFLLEFEGKRVIYSGDVKKPEELDALIGDGVELLIHETGHHTVDAVCTYADSRNVKRLRFNHHGREIIGGREASDKRALACVCDAKIAYEGMTEEI